MNAYEKVKAATVAEIPSAGVVRAERSPAAALGLFLLLTFTLFVRFPMLHVPLERDEGGYAYAAWIWSEGGVPYRDSFDNKPPLLISLYRAAFALFGSTPEAAHLLLIIVALAETLLIFVLARRLLGEKAALAAAFCFSLLSAEPAAGVGNAANTEAFMLLPILGAAALLPASPFLSGLCAGAAVMVKQTAVFEGFAFGLFLLVSLWRSKKGWGGLLPAARYGLGAIIVPAMFGIYFWSAGAWRDFFYCVFLYNAEYGSQVAQGGMVLQGFKELSWVLARLAPAESAVWAAAGAGLVACAVRRRPEHLFLSLWLFASLLGVSAGFRYLSHYLVQAAPALALAAGGGIAFALDRWRNRPAWADVGVLGFVLLPYLAVNRAFWLSGAPESISRALYHTNPFVEAAPVARYIQENSSPEDRVYVFGSEPEILFYAKRRSATRYIHFYPLTGEFAKAPAMQRQAVREVEAARPLFLLWVNEPLSHMAGPHTDRFILNKTLEWTRDGSYELEGLVFSQPGQPSQYIWGREKARAVPPEKARLAKLSLYRRIE